MNDLNIDEIAEWMDRPLPEGSEVDGLSFFFLMSGLPNIISGKAEPPSGFTAPRLLAMLLKSMNVEIEEVRDLFEKFNKDMTDEENEEWVRNLVYNKRQRKIKDFITKYRGILEENPSDEVQSEIRWRLNTLKDSGEDIDEDDMEWILQILPNLPKISSSLP